MLSYFPKRTIGAAVGKSILWFAMFVIVILGADNTALASAMHGVNRLGGAELSSAFPVHPPRRAKLGRVAASHTIRRHIGVQKRPHFVRNARLLPASPISTWPLSLPFLMFPIVIPTAPITIVMSDMPRNAPAQTAFETPPDYGYVPGCHVIRNGYHCDIPHNETAP